MTVAFDRFGQHTGVMCLGCGQYVYVLHSTWRNDGTHTLQRCLSCTKDLEVEGHHQQDTPSLPSSG